MFGEQKTLIIGVKIKKMKIRETNIKMRLTFVISIILQCDTEANHFRIKRQILFCK